MPSRPNPVIFNSRGSKKFKLIFKLLQIISSVGPGFKKNVPYMIVTYLSSLLSECYNNLLFHNN